MKQGFLKFCTVIGVLVVSLIAFAFVMSFLGRFRKPTIPARTVLEFELRSLPEESPSDPFALLRGEAIAPRSKTSPAPSAKPPPTPARSPALVASSTQCSRPAYRPPGLLRQHQPDLYVVLTAVVMTASVMISYTRARAENTIPSCKVGFLERPERIVLLIIGALFDKMAPVLWLIAVLGNITVIHRMMFTFTQAPLLEDAQRHATPLTRAASSQTE